MKNTLSSLIRHSLTALAGVGGLLLSHGLLASGDLAQVNAAGGQLQDALTVIGSAVGLRLAIMITGKIFPATAAKLSGAAGGLVPLWIGLTTAAFMGALPSCSPAELAAARAIPIKTCVVTDYGTACYSSKSGLAVSVDATSGK